MFATKNNTQEFKEKAIQQNNAAPEHFKDVFGLTLSSIGLGTYLGEPTLEVDKEVEEAIRMCIHSKAVNVIDTAINYRYQRAERVIGATLKDLITHGALKREEVFISTKLGYIAPGEEKYYGKIEDYVVEQIIHANILDKHEINHGNHSMSVKFLEFEFEQSLLNLQVEGIDLLYLHNAAESHLEHLSQNEFFEKLENIFRFFERLRERNRIKYYGLATWDCFRVLPNNPLYLSLEKVVQLAKNVGGSNHGFKFVQAPFNYVDHQIVSLKNQYLNNELFSLAAVAEKLDVKLFTSVPLKQGKILSPVSLRPRFMNIHAPMQSALQYARSAHPSIIGPLVGMKKPEHIKENMDVAKLKPATSTELELAF